MQTTSITKSQTSGRLSFSGVEGTEQFPRSRASLEVESVKGELLTTELPLHLPTWFSYIWNRKAQSPIRTGLLKTLVSGQPR